MSESASLPFFAIELLRLKWKMQLHLLRFSMPCHKLPNYLRSYRKRAGLSQDEVAFLLGCQSSAHVSRYEHFKRVPSLRTVLAYKVIFKTPTNELFAGAYQRVEQAVRRRARRLAARLSTARATPRTARKLVFLKTIMAAPAEVQHS